MRFYNYLKITILSLICVILLQPSAHAVWPTLDSTAIAQNAQSILQKIDQYKTQIMESKTVTSINKAIGDAKSSLSKFKTDALQEAKAKADKLKKAKEKLDKIKKKVEDAKKEYEKKKAQFDDYKKKVEDAKKQVADKIDEGKKAYNDAKGAYDDAKGSATTAAGLVNQTVNSAQNSINNITNDAQKHTPSEANTVPQDSTAETTKQVQSSGGRVQFTSPNNNSTSQNTNTTSQSVSITSGTDSVSQAASIAAEQGTSAGVAAINAAVEQAVATGDVQTLEKISTLDESEIITSDSKVYDEPTNGGRQTFSSPEETENTANEPTSVAPSATPASSAKIKGIIRNNDRIPNNATSSPASQSTDINGIKGNIQINRRAFGTPEKESFFLDDGDYVRQSSLIASQETLTFADFSECSDYNNAIQNEKDGEIIITSETLAKECCFKAENLTDMNIIQECTNKLLNDMHDEDATIAEEAKGIYSVIAAEQNVYGLTEAWKDKADSSSYFANVLTEYIEDSDIARKEGSTNEGIASIALTNTESLYLMNRIRRIFTASLVNSSIGNIGSVKPETLNEETEIGLGEVTEDYDYSVVRGLRENAKSAESADAAIEYPVLPENFAKKCQLKLDADNIAKVKDCYYQTVAEANDKDFTKADVGKNFIDNIKYQNMLINLGKSLYQKVKTAKYDEELEVIKKNITDSQDERTNYDALFRTDVEMQKTIDELIQIYAARIAASSLDNIGQLTPKAENNNNTEGQQNG